MPIENNLQKIQYQFSNISEFESSEDYKVANNFSGTVQEMIEGNKCYLRNITEENSSWIKTYRRNIGKKFYTSNGIGTLKCYSLKTGNLMSKNFTIQSFLQDNKNIGCDLIYRDEFGKSYPLTIK